MTPPTPPGDAHQTTERLHELADQLAANPPPLRVQEMFQQFALECKLPGSDTLIIGDNESVDTTEDACAYGLMLGVALGMVIMSESTVEIVGIEIFPPVEDDPE